ncbi:hypothetical protein TSUD_295610 [Trifolium subterraneum]|uniref:Uncharacterized protein n=1 Tax=Trifolium subterraneum TaxID=3900 RepID=A0A2Z6M6W1_TRISU|nr:hypothetical protein TSUD_295610 [Trifolium subterraneum]
MLIFKTIGQHIKLGDINEGIPIIKHRLQRKKVLLILDDVHELKQLQVLAGGLDWFGPGSRVIITTRDKQLIASHGIERTYEIDKFTGEEALELLRWKAFKNNKIESCYEDILQCAVSYASGLPLALEVVGSNLYGKRVEEWKSTLNRYERTPNKEIQKILKVSCDGLEEDEQGVFLDISCCFKGHKLAEVEDILTAHHGECMKYAIGVLVEKSLIKIGPRNYLTLHDLIECTGKEIVRQESPKEPGKRSRYPSQHIPSDFCPKKLSICKLPESNLTLFELHSSLKADVREFDRVKFKQQSMFETNTQRCSKLKSFPPMKLNSLERLELSFCESLELFPEILGQMKSIERIILKGTSIEEFPLSFQNHTGLHTLRIWGGGMLRLSGSILLMPSLSDIYAQGCQLLPIQNDELNSTVFSNVQELWLIKCNLPDELLPTVLMLFANVPKLRLINCKILGSNFKILPECIEECLLLSSLILNCCKYIREVKGIPPNLKYMYALRCESLASSSRSMLLNQELHVARSTEFSIAGTARVPEWFEHLTKGPSISFWFRKKIPSIALRVVSKSMDNKSLKNQFHLLRVIMEMEKSILKNEWNYVEVTYENMIMIPILTESGFHILKHEEAVVELA